MNENKLVRKRPQLNDGHGLLDVKITKDGNNVEIFVTHGHNKEFYQELLQLVTNVLEQQIAEAKTEVIQ